jgi:hypothetical protein
MIRLFFFLTIFNFSLILKAQTANQVFTKADITWYGLDFSVAKFKGTFTNFDINTSKSPATLRDLYFPGWNNVVVEEKDKYDLKKFCKKSTVFYNITKATDINAHVNPDSMITLNPVPVIPLDKIELVVSNYKDPFSGGIGLVFIIECFDTSNDVGSMHMAFFDIQTGKLLFKRRIQTSPGGFGVRNYWIRTVYNAMLLMQKNWKKWEKEISNQ